MTEIKLCCPECDSTEGNECPTCCSHASMEVKTVKEGRYLREICECNTCGYFDTVNELDYYTEFPCL